MKEKQLNKVLRTRARELGLCDKWYDEWDKRSTRQELIEKYINGIDFCIKHDYPSLDFVRAEFPKDLLLLNGIFLDEQVDGQNLLTAVLIGSSKGIIRYDGNRVGSIYVRHQSVLDIVAEEGARVFVEIYDGAKVSVKTDLYSKAFVYQHGGIVGETEGNVTVRDKRLGTI